jgi:DNA polymerase-1
MAVKKLFLIDGNALVYRAHFAFIKRPLINSKGVNTSAISGFTRALWDLWTNQNPSHIAVCFDVSEKTFRNEMYEEYKANRDEQPEDIQIAFPYIRKLVEGFNIPIIEKGGYEADDVIGTLARRAAQDGFEVYMVTPDKDFGQLVTDQIFLYKPSRQGNGVDIMGVEKICKKWDVEHPDQVIDVLGLAGDSIDNIPGVPGVGPKTASKLLKQYGSMEGIYEHVDELKGKLKERMADNKEQALLSKKLARIKIDVPIDWDPDSLTKDPIDKESLASLFKDLEFRTMAEKILGEKAPEQGDLFSKGTASDSVAPSIKDHSVAEKTLEDVEHEYIYVDTAEKRQKLLERLEKSSCFAFDTETDSLDPLEAELVGISFAFQAHEAFYLPIPAEREPAQVILDEFKAVFENKYIEKVAQNIKYDMLVLRKYDIRVAGFFWDTMILHYLYEPDLRHNMDFMAESYLKYKPVPIKNLIGKKGKNQKSMRDIPQEDVVEYAAEDADITWQLYEFLRNEMKDRTIEKIYKEIEEPLITVLADMEEEGVGFDGQQMEALAKELQEKINTIEKEIYEEAGTEFNVASPKQVGEVLFGKMELPYRWRKTKSGQYSTNEEKLSELAEQHKIAGQVLEYRALTKLLSTYVKALPKMVNPRTGRIHTSFNQALAATGRLSSNNPNLQNIPIRTEEGRKVRKAFVPRSEDFVLLAADYSQVELRLIAEMSGDENMLDAFKHGRDIHRATAAGVFEVDYEAVTDDQRRSAKTVNFSIIYGAGATNLSNQLDISRKEAGQLIDQYFKTYPGLKRYMDEIVKSARETEYVETLSGRRRYLRDINSRNNMVRSGAERIAINTPVQGTAADMIKWAMVDIHAYLRKQNCKTRMTLQVHDELVFDLHHDEKEELLPIIEEKMRSAMKGLSVPIVVECGLGQNWLEAH